MKMPKLLAPAGTPEMAFAAIAEGADVLYVGPLGWSRRPYESELTDEEIRLVIDHARERGREARVVLNTFPSPFEIDEFIAKVRRYDAWGASGFIVTDPGAIGLIRRLLPETLIHVSIGSGIANAEDAAFYHEAGADMIILPYRWGEDEIEAVRATTSIGMEVFLFETVQTGKICPGKCIMSSYLRFRDWRPEEGKTQFFGSANRGAKECYRVCQAAWEFGPADEPPQTLKLRRDAHLMLEQLPGFVHRGVEFFKLSGRERPVPMIRDLVRFYRRVLDAIVAGDGNLESYLPELMTLRERWVTEKSKRVDTLMDRAATYQTEGRPA